MTLRYESVIPRHDSASDEQIRVTVPVEVAKRDGRSVLKEIRQSVRSSAETPAAIVDVKAIAQLLRVSPELVAAAHDEEIRMSVPVRIEENRVDILGNAVRGKGRLTAGTEGSV